jgi:tRNA nucleotidyltransferase/poly(A) polymerase
MADYIYLLETRLSSAQQGAIGLIRNVAREAENTIFLTGGAVRDLTGGGSIRDLDLTLQGDALKLKKALEKAGATVVGENAPAGQLFLTFPGGVRVELSSAMSVTFPKPGKPKYEPGNITDDLRRRDFTANAMAISLNEGSYGLLMDPLNGVADIENRELRLVSNYGFIEDPARLIRAARLSSRLSWQLEEKTQQRYDTAKDEGYISALSPWSRGYELEEIFHEEDPVRILRALEAEGWMAALDPELTAAKANTAALSELADKQGQLQVQGILSQAAAIAFPLVTGKMSATEVARLKEMFVRPGFVREIESVDVAARDFAAKLGGKEFATPSAAWRLLYSTEPNLVLSAFYGSKSAPVQSRIKTFLAESPTARQRIPYSQMAEMRIVPDLPIYAELVDKLFFELMDGKLSTPEEIKAYLEPFSPPAPPPPVNLRRARARKEARPSRAKGKKAAAAAEVEATSVAAEEELIGIAEGIMEEGDLTGPDRGPEPTEHDPIESVAPEPATKKPALARKAIPAPVKATPAPAKAPAKAAPVKPAKKAVPAKPAPPAKKAVPAKKAAPAKAIPVKAVAKKAVVKAPAKKAPAKVVAKKAVPAKRTPAKKSAPVKVVAKKAVAKKAAPAKAVAKKAVPAKKAPAKVVAKKAAKKSGRR